MRHLIWAVLAAALTIAVPGQEADEPAQAEETAALDFRQVDFQLMRVIPEHVYANDPQAYDRLEAVTLSGDQISLPVESEPLMRVTELDRAVIYQDRLGLHHLELYFTEADAAAHADITEANAGSRLVWASHGNILVDLVSVGRDEKGGFSVFYGDAPLERIENVLQVLQVDYAREQSEEMIEPDNPADELRLEAMRVLNLRPNEEGRREAMDLLAQCMQVAEEDYEYRPTVLFVLGGLSLQQGQPDLARRFFEEIRARHPDFFDYVTALRTLRALAEQRGDVDEQRSLNREIVEHEDRQGVEALSAQGHLVNLLWSEAASAEAEAETRTIINMLRNHIAGLPQAERFDYELALIGYHMKLGETEDLMRLARARLSNLPTQDQEALIQVVQVLELLAVYGHGEQALELAQEYAAQLESTIEEGEEPPPNWEPMQQVIEQLRDLLSEESEASG